MNKYRAVKVCQHGLDRAEMHAVGHDCSLSFDSKREYERWCNLRMLASRDAISDLEHHVSYPIVVNGEPVCRYEADFVYTRDGKRVIEDCKGVRTPVYRLKKKLLRAVWGYEILET